jgi:hypothetical protein
MTWRPRSNPVPPRRDCDREKFATKKMQKSRAWPSSRPIPLPDLGIQELLGFFRYSISILLFGFVPKANVAFTVSLFLGGRILRDVFGYDLERRPADFLLQAGGRVCHHSLLLPADYFAFRTFQG